METRDFIPQKIFKVEESVSNRIAAGQVIGNPFNCVKELIENSIDAKASQIQVTIKGAGWKYLQVQDNGTGILKDDFEILCERYTTSKLRTIEELKNVRTYGFRGEALNCISMISRLTIQTKTREEIVAYKAYYENGKLVGKATPCAGNQGTTITVEDLYYTYRVRQAEFKVSEEYSKIFEVVASYAIHNYPISFTLKKHGENNSFKTQSNNKSSIDVVRVIYGNTIANSLMEVTAEDESLKFKMNGYVSNADYSGTRDHFTLFVNNRLVEEQRLKRTLCDDLYRTVLTKNVHPFIYVSIEIHPDNIDFNVTPTKHEVIIRHADLIFNHIKEAAEKILLKTNETKKVYTQQLLPGATVTFETSMKENDRVYAKDRIRTDAKSQSIVKFFYQESPSSAETSQQILSVSPAIQKPKKKEMTELTSIKELIAEIEAKSNENFKKEIRNLTFVGNVDRSKTLIQCDINLYMCDNRKLAFQLFYQLSLRNFENFDAIEFDEPLKIRELARIALDLRQSGWTEEDGSKEELAMQVENILTEQRDMLREYLKISINEKAELETLPLIVENYAPLFAHIPIFILRLATEVNYEDEKECFRNICTELANFYSKWSLKASTQKQYNHLMEHIIFPKIRSSLMPPEKFLSDGTFLKMTDTDFLYKVFERC